MRAPKTFVILFAEKNSMDHAVDHAILSGEDLGGEQLLGCTAGGFLGGGGGWKREKGGARRGEGKRGGGKKGMGAKQCVTISIYTVSHPHLQPQPPPKLPILLPPRDPDPELHAKNPCGPDRAGYRRKGRGDLVVLFAWRLAPR